MSQNYDLTSRYRPHIHWNDENFYEEIRPFATVRKRAHRISLNASLPYYSKLNVRLNTNRSQQVITSATIQRLDSSSNYRPVQQTRSSTHRPINVPVSLSNDRRIFLYIRDGEIFARC